MISDVDYSLLMLKLEKFQARLEALEKEIQAIKQLTPIPSVWPNNPSDLPKPRNPYRDLSNIPCAFDNLPPEDRRKPMGISCPCPKCSPYALSYGSLTDSGTKQEWRLAKDNEDAEE